MFQLALFNGPHELPTISGILKKKTGYTRRSLENSLWRFHDNKLVCQIQYKWLSKINSLTVTHWAFIYNGKVQERVAFGKTTVLKKGYEFDVIPEIEFAVLKSLTTRR